MRHCIVYTGTITTETCWSISSTTICRFLMDKISVFEDKHKYVIINNYMYKNKYGQYEQIIQGSHKRLKLCQFISWTVNLQFTKLCTCYKIGHGFYKIWTFNLILENEIRNVIFYDSSKFDFCKCWICIEKISIYKVLNKC